MSGIDQEQIRYNNAFGNIEGSTIIVGNENIISISSKLLRETIDAKESIIILAVTNNSIKSTYQFEVIVDGRTIISDQYLSSQELERLKEISQLHHDLFRFDITKEEISTKQEAAAHDLFEIWLSSSWDAINKMFEHKSQCTLVIASDIPDVLNLPWELLRPNDGEFLGMDSSFRIRRLPKNNELDRFRYEVPFSPIRVFFMACAPTDQAPLNDVLEDNIMVETMNLLNNVPFTYGKYSTFEEFKNLIEEFRPHVVHLTGHGSVENGEGIFAFEDVNGHSDFRFSSEINRVLAKNGVLCVFINICQRNDNPSVEVLNKMCQGIISREVPFAIGWPTSLSEDQGTAFAQKFYERLARHNTIDDALFEARQHIWRILDIDENPNPSWALPVLYSYTDQKFYFAECAEGTNKELNQQTRVQQTSYRLFKGQSVNFFPRKREEQRLLPALIDGRLKTVVITGIEGCGKSTLAFELSKRLQLTTRDFIEITINCSIGDPLSLDQLLNKFSESLLEAAFNHSLKDNELMARRLKAACKILIDTQLPQKNRLISFTNTILRDYPFLIIFDNFEVNLDEVSLEIKDSGVAEFYKNLVLGLSGESRAIIISQYMPSDLYIFPSTAIWEPLMDIDNASCSNFLLNTTHNLPNNILHDLYRTFGGNPGFVSNINSYIKDTNIDQIKKELNSLILFRKSERQFNRSSKSANSEAKSTLVDNVCPNRNSKMNLDNNSVNLIPREQTKLVNISNKRIEKAFYFIHDSYSNAQDYINAEEQKELIYAFKIQAKWLKANINSIVKKANQKVLSALSGNNLVYQQRVSALDITPRPVTEVFIDDNKIDNDKIDQESEKETFKIPRESGELGRKYLSWCENLLC